MAFIPRQFSLPVAMYTALGVLSPEPLPGESSPSPFSDVVPRRHQQCPRAVFVLSFLSEPSLSGVVGDSRVMCALGLASAATWSDFLF